MDAGWRPGARSPTQGEGYGGASGWMLLWQKSSLSYCVSLSPCSDKAWPTARSNRFHVPISSFCLASRMGLRRKEIGLLVVSLEGSLREHAPGIRVSFSLPRDGPDLVVSCFVLPLPVESRPSPRLHTLGVLVAEELEALRGGHQIQVLVVFLAHSSLDLPVRRP